MDKLTIIDCKKSTDTGESREEKMERLYMKAFGRELAVISAYNKWDVCRDNIKRAVFYIVKYYGMNRVDFRYSGNPRTHEEVKNDFTLLECVKKVMAQLTPNEIISIFPIAKEYDGEKWGCKDYFYTVEKLKEYDLDSPLGQESLEDFLWDYWNDDLFSFSATAMSIIGNMYRLQTGKGILDDFCEKNNIGSVTVNKELGIIRDNQTGEIQKMSKRTSHLRIVK